ncbi:hypothetical protein BDV27DRAFT_164724 [Aspergillus caelatus]|uniref:Secreted protein n=1 Tax=Aspergillus caelatus TaxID=61420 RepID=A0A5N6ZHU8_9EURO|nr:uncharacterized protein BDV27DRAFT_164724 [Aspergillus caelatus]KAE8357211.1 hypothetical protein BDV27DRAFT_164724 [Aspergillus caelatus]
MPYTLCVLRLLLELVLLEALLGALLDSLVLGPPRYIGVGDGGDGGGGIPLGGAHLDAFGRPPPWGFGASIAVPEASGGLSRSIDALK